MRLWRPTRACVALLGTLLLLPSVVAFTPIPPDHGPTVALPAYTTLEGLLHRDGAYGSPDLAGEPYVADQMMGILANLRLRTNGAPLAPNASQRVIEAWTSAEDGFVAGSTFYANVFPAPASVSCVDATVNAWALWAAFETRSSGIAIPDLDINRRVEDLRSLVEGLVLNGRAATHGACNTENGRLRDTHASLPVLVLLVTRAGPGSVNTDNAVRSALDHLIANNLRDGFADRNGLYLATFNSQMLLALTEAARIYGHAPYAQARDQTGRFIEQNLTLGSGQTIYLQQRGTNGATAAGAAGPTDYLWAAAALENYGQVRALRNPSIVQGLLKTFHQTFWSSTRGAYMHPDGILVDAHALAVILTRPIGVRIVGADAPTLTVIIPAEVQFQYPVPAPRGAYVSGTWSTRFSLASEPAGDIDVLLPASLLNPFNLSNMLVSNYGPVRLVRTSGAAQQSEVPVQVVPGNVDVVRFSNPLSTTPSTFRFDAFPPIEPLYSRAGVAILVGVYNRGDRPIHFNSIQFELDAINVTVQRATQNGEALEEVGQLDMITTEDLPRPHTRIVVPDATIQPFDETEFKFEFSDVQPPRIGELLTTRGNLAEFGVPDETPVKLLRGEALRVRADIDDNVVVRTVSARLQQGALSRDVPVQDMGDGGYEVDLGILNRTGPGVLRLSAVDVSGNFNARSLELDVMNPNVSGSVVLFVFSGTLFVSAVIIWAKVRRKPI